MAAASTRPYLIRGIFDWAIDNGFTPFVLVDTRVSGVTVPTQFVKDNSIVLNISPGAVKDLTIGDEYISFNARFSGVAQELFVPIESVRAVYAKENGEGIVLPENDQSGIAMTASLTEQNSKPDQPGTTQDRQKLAPKTEPKPEKKRPHLKIVE